jgi:hypothetical protein
MNRINSSDREYITTCTHTQIFDKTKFGSENRETILAKTVVVDVKPNKNVSGIDSWFDTSPHGYTFKIKDGDGVEKWVYYDWFLVPNTAKNVSIIDEIERINKEIENLQQKQETLRKSYDY